MTGSARPRRRATFFLAPALCLELGAGAFGQSYSFERIAALGDPVPGEARLEVKFDFETGGINEAGSVAFGADICDRKQADACNDIGEGIFLRSAQGETRTIALAGRQVPGGGVFAGGFLGRIFINEPGDVAFSFNMPEGPGLFLHTAEGDLRTIVKPLEPAPCGGTFKAACFDPVINNKKEIVFYARVTNLDINPGQPPEVPGDDDKIGSAIFLRESRGAIRPVVCPGDRGPSLADRGGPEETVFDFLTQPWINDRGDIAFGGHLLHMECTEFAPAELCTALCGTSVFLKEAGSDNVIPVALHGDPVLGDRKIRLAFNPIINNRGEVLFQGDLTPFPAITEDVALFLYSDGSLTPVVRAGTQGDIMPGGGKLQKVIYGPGPFYLNDCGDVVFQCTLDSSSLDIDGDGEMEPDQGVFVWSRGKGTRLVARTGMDLSGNGKLLALLPPDFLTRLPAIYPYTWFNASINDRGQIPFVATVEDDEGNVNGVVILATPQGEWPCDRGDGVAFLRGDPDADGAVNITDAVFVLNHLFLGGEAPTCRDAADMDDDGQLIITDPVYLLNHLFRSGPAPRPPYPYPTCGSDEEDDLGCEAFGACEPT